jgi:AcrR family transcriptional regulator
VTAVPGHGRLGRPPLTERRKAATRLEIAREAVRLFTARGVAATSADEIAAAAGISTRTLWRYFPTKESCVLPLLTGGIELTARHLRAWRPGEGMADLVAAMRDDPGDITADRRVLLDLVRLTATDPALRAVWLDAHRQAEPLFAAALADRAGLPAADLTVKIQAAVINAALRTAVEHYAATSPDEENILADTVTESLMTAARGFFH